MLNIMSDFKNTVHLLPALKTKSVVLVGKIVFFQWSCLKDDNKIPDSSTANS